MSSIRKLKRRNLPVWQAEKPKVRLSVKDIVLIIGLTLVLLGTISGFFKYHTYTAGSPAHIWNSRLGTEYTPEKASGDPNDKAAAILSFALAGIGLLLTTASLIFIKNAKGYY